MVTKRIIDDFLIRLYFDTQYGYYKAGLKRAYLDFNRTLPLKGQDQKERDLIKNDVENKLLVLLKGLIEVPIYSQNIFDEKHKNICNQLKLFWGELTFGHCQKWVNMTLKYWLVFGNEKIVGIEKNYVYFHIPIDSYVQKGMFKNMIRNHKPWSKFEFYEEYFLYQTHFRIERPDEIPIESEFTFFNNQIKTKTNFKYKN